MVDFFLVMVIVTITDFSFVPRFSFILLMRWNCEPWTRRRLYKRFCVSCWRFSHLVMNYWRMSSEVIKCLLTAYSHTLASFSSFPSSWRSVISLFVVLLLWRDSRGGCDFSRGFCQNDSVNWYQVMVFLNVDSDCAVFHHHNESPFKDAEPYLWCGPSFFSSNFWWVFCSPFEFCFL